jgi:hypothetical protein
MAQVMIHSKSLAQHF